MDNATRLQYLQAMGIDVWVSRDSESVEVSLPVNDAKFNASEPVENNVELVIDNWSALQQEVSECQKCELCKTRTQTVFGAGNVNADWMLVGDEPGERDDVEGKPFVGASGVLLTEMIRAIGLQRESVYITNIIKCNPVDNREAKTEEVNSCNDFLLRQIALVKPKVILAVGRMAAQALLGSKEPLSGLRGKVHQLNGIPVVVVYHPSYLLRSMHEKRKAWQDLQLAIKQIRN